MAYNNGPIYGTSVKERFPKSNIYECGKKQIKRESERKRKSGRKKLMKNANGPLPDAHCRFIEDTHQQSVDASYPLLNFFFFVLVCTKLLLVFAFLLKHYLVRNKMAVRKRLARCKCVSGVRRIYFYQACISFYNFVLVCLIFNFLSARLKI